MTGKEMAAMVVAAVRRAVDAATQALAVRLDSLEKCVAEIPAGPTGAKGDPGERGEKGDAGDPGDAGRDGRDGTPGERGERGASGSDGRDGSSIAADQVSAMVDAEVQRRVPEEVAKRMADFEAAADAREKERFARWALEFERGAQDTMQRAVDRLPAPAPGKDGRDGTNGVDGFSLDDFSAKLSADGRTVLLSFKHGERIDHAHLTFPVVLDRGVFLEGKTYATGDGVTWAGNYWIAQRDTGAKPDAGDDWRLAVRKGRDGKNGERGRDYVAPLPVKVG